jgi:hypothetical protein
MCNFFPRTALENGGKLYEYLGAKPSEGGTPKAGVSATSPQLLAELISRADSGLSTAIFWTSQGLNVLGQAIVPGFTGIPGCSTLPLQDNCKDLKAPRNAAYVLYLTEAVLSRQPRSRNMYDASMFILTSPFPHRSSSGLVVRRTTVEMEKVALVTCHQ